MKIDTHKTIYLKAYKPYPYALDHLDLNFDLREGHTIVTAKSTFTKKEHAPLFLNGEGVVLKKITLNSKELSALNYELTDMGLTLPAPQESEFTLEIETLIEPEKNTRLEGLYMSGGNYCTQCEAEGFRRITYYPDRPDVLATFTTRIEADAANYPVLLSNGNKTGEGKLDNGRHFTVWTDPFPKPCYLFALVAGNLTQIHDTYTTGSGRKVDIYIYVRPDDEGQCAHAMESLKKSMKWDEDAYGLEYDLDLFNIVAVSDFNMGAMENKSLNIFNTALVLAHQDTATDIDFSRVESVIAHEYFHNWSGNRVTCRDWFQLSLKEGLTVFRDQEFSADLNSSSAQRIDDVTHLRRMQFVEDAGPLAHPIRPDNYIEINNFYTMTVYEKGAEVIRMMRTILGSANYRKGTDLYFKRHDGQAATCDDFVKCMEDASQVDLSHFKLWYEQAGTPEISFTGKYDAGKKTYTVELSQTVPATPNQPHKKPMFIPVSLGLLNDNGDDMDLGGGETTKILPFAKGKQNFILENIASKPVPSVLRNFSAPVKLKTDLSEDDLVFLMVHDSDGFNRWEAGQTYALRTIHHMLDSGESAPAKFIAAYGELLDQGALPDFDNALAAQALTLPDISMIGQSRNLIDPVAIHNTKQKLELSLLGAHKSKIETLYKARRGDKTFSVTAEAMGKRALCNTVLRLLCLPKDSSTAALAKQHYQSANNMTDRVAALACLAHMDEPERAEIFTAFYKQFKDYMLVIDKWFALQASAIRPTIINDLISLRAHPDFNIRNPNRVRSLYASFAMNNPVSFHNADGSGYEFLTNAVIELNMINPQIASRLLTPMRDWRNYTPDRQEKMKACLQKILGTPKLSPDVFEIASKSLKT
ncbi:MAG: aminopeptidase N [Alphaproteobacteria bacterium]